MATISVTTTNKRENHQLIAVQLENRTTWQQLVFPDWADGAEIINFGTSDIFLSTDKADTDAAVSGDGVKLASGTAYEWRAGGPDPIYMAVRHAAGSTYEIGVAVRTRGNS